MYVTSGEKGFFVANFIVSYLGLLWLQKRRKIDTCEIGRRKDTLREVTVKNPSLAKI